MSAPPLPCLTVVQPWATLEALGLKGAETRNWAPRHLVGRRIAIHAAARWSVPQLAFAAGAAPVRAALEAAGYRLSADPAAPGMLPLGVVVATARLTAIVEYARLAPEERRRTAALAMGDHEHGRFAWLLGEVERLPVPVRASGSRGIWEWTPPG